MNLDNDIIIWFHVRRVSRKNLTDDIYKIDSIFCLCISFLAKYSLIDVPIDPGELEKALCTFKGNT